MFDTVIEVPDWDFDVRDSGPSDPAVELVSVWDVLAGRVDPGPDAIRALASVDPQGLGAGGPRAGRGRVGGPGRLAGGAEAVRVGRDVRPGAGGGPG